MIKRVLAFVCLLWSMCSASAAVGDYVPITKWYLSNNNVKYFDPASWCVVYGTINNKFTGDNKCVASSVVSTSANQLQQNWSWQIKGSSFDWTYTGTASAYCDPAYYTGPVQQVAGGQYYCKVVTPPPPVCPIGSAWEDWYPWSNNSKPYFPVCSDSNCLVTVTELKTCMTLGSTGVRWCDFAGKITGGTCNASTDNTNNSNYGMPQNTAPSGTSTRADMPPTSNPTCPAGSVQGGVDSSGIPICIGTGTTPTNPSAPPTTTTKPPVTTNNSDGSTVTLQDTLQSNSDGSTTTTTTKTTTAADGTKTTLVTYTTTAGTAGTPGKMDTPTADQSNLCKQNPNLSICQTSSVSGSCGTLSCTGDAVQCAQLRAEALMQCKQAQDDTDFKASSAYTLGTAAMAGNDPQGSTLPSPSKATQITAPAALDQTTWLTGGAQCFADKVVTFRGMSVTLPYSKACDYLVVLRAGLMVIASLVSFRILREAILT